LGPAKFGGLATILGVCTPLACSVEPPLSISYCIVSYNGIALRSSVVNGLITAKVRYGKAIVPENAHPAVPASL